MKLHWRAHMNDMNKRMGELRNAEGEHGVWARMVRGESEYKNTKAQYNRQNRSYRVGDTHGKIDSCISISEDVSVNFKDQPASQRNYGK